MQKKIYYNFQNLIKVEFSKGGEHATEYFWQTEIKILGIKFRDSGYKKQRTNIINWLLETPSKRLPIHLQTIPNEATTIIVYKPSVVYYFLGGTRVPKYFDTITAARNHMKTMETYANNKYIFI